ncbi:MAG: eCIS core domain-containing protein [Nitrososphaeraceae archaeon]
MSFQQIQKQSATKKQKDNFSKDNPKNQDYNQAYHLLSDSINFSITDINLFDIDKVIQRISMCTCGGSCTRCPNSGNTRKTRISNIYSKPKINDVDDPLEGEADDVAEQIVNISNAHIKVNSKQNGQTNQNLIQISHRNIVNKNSNYPEEFTEDIIKVTNNSGKSLNPTTKEFMESRFGYNFSNVRIHDDAESDHLTNLIQARAFTYDEHIFLSSYESESDKKLLAHELVHVIQQNYLPVEERLIQRKGRRKSSVAFNIIMPISPTEDFVVRPTDTPEIKESKKRKFLIEFIKYQYGIDNDIEAVRIMSDYRYTTEDVKSFVIDQLHHTITVQIQTSFEVFDEKERKVLDSFFDTLPEKDREQIQHSTNRRFWQETHYKVKESLNEYDDPSIRQYWTSTRYGLISARREFEKIPEYIKNYIFKRGSVRFREKQPENYLLALNIGRKLQSLTKEEFAEYTSRVTSDDNLKELEVSVLRYLPKLSERKRIVKDMEMHKEKIKPLEEWYKRYYKQFERLDANPLKWDPYFDPINERLQKEILPPYKMTPSEFYENADNYALSFLEIARQVAYTMLDQYESKLIEQENRYLSLDEFKDFFNNFEMAYFYPEKKKETSSKHWLLSDPKLFEDFEDDYSDWYDKHSIQHYQGLFRNFINEKKKDIERVRRRLGSKEGAEIIFKNNLDFVESAARKIQSVEEHSAYHYIILHKKKMLDASSVIDFFFTILAVASAFFSVGTGLAFVAGTIAVAKDAYDAFSAYSNYRIESAAFEVQLRSEDPSLLWVVAAFATIPLDLGPLFGNAKFVSAIDRFNKNPNLSSISSLNEDLTRLGIDEKHIRTITKAGTKEKLIAIETNDLISEMEIIDVQRLIKNGDEGFDDLLKEEKKILHHRLKEDLGVQTAKKDLKGNVDMEVKVGEHTYRRDSITKKWCRHTEPICDLESDESLISSRIIERIETDPRLGITKSEDVVRQIEKISPGGYSSKFFREWKLETREKLPIDLEYIGPNETLTNLELMKAGRPPWIGNKRVDLHHVDMDFFGRIDEVLVHNAKDLDQHILLRDPGYDSWREIKVKLEKGPRRDRWTTLEAIYDQKRESYWKRRAFLLERQKKIKERGRLMKGKKG